MRGDYEYEPEELELIDAEDYTDDLDGYDDVENNMDLELFELGLDERAQKIAPKKGEPITFRLLFAIILASIFLFTTPWTAKQLNLQEYWWAPMIAAFIGALIGGYLGSILDAFNYKSKASS